ncbi:MAG: hypothetical protein V4481_00705 [Patescibacteria group bacterium]
MKKNTIFTILVSIAALVLGYYLYLQGTETQYAQIDSYEECAAAGYPILESYPEQCKTPDGRTFTKEIPSPTGSPITHVRPLTNPRYGVAFTYPDIYVQTEKEVGTKERFHDQIVLINKKDLPLPSNGEGPPVISVDIFDNSTDKQSLDGWVRNSGVSNFSHSNGAYATTTVDGIAAITYNWSGLYGGETTVFLHKGNIVAVSVTYLSPKDQILGDYQYVLNSMQVSDTKGVIPELL